MEDSNIQTLKQGLSPHRTLLSSPNQKSRAAQKSKLGAQDPSLMKTDDVPASISSKTNEETAVLNGQVVRFKKMFNPHSHNEVKKDEDIINGAVLTLEQSFGFMNTVIDKNSQFISEDTLVYPSGRHLATIDLVSRRMDFIKREDSSFNSSITALQVGLSRKKELVVAIAEKSPNNNPRVSIYIPSRLRWFRLEHDQELLGQVSDESVIEQIYLPNYKKYCITVSRPNEKSNLVVSYFRYEKEKLSRFNEVKPQVRKITVDPKNHYHFLACGKSYLKMYDASDKHFKEMKEAIIPIKYERENDFLECIFIQESIFVTVTAQNNFFIIENGLVKYYINISFSTKNSIRNLKAAAKQDGGKDSDYEGNNLLDQNLTDDGSNASISCFAAHKKGFVVGSKNGGYIGVYEIERDFSINHVDTFKVDPKCSEVTSVAISFDRQYLAINAKIQEEVGNPLLQSGNEQEEQQFAQRMEMFYLNLHQLSVLKNVFTLPIKPVFPKGNIIGSLVDMSIGISKDMIVTVGQDKYIRVFEYGGSQHAVETSVQPASQPNQLVIPTFNSGQLSQISSQRSKDQVFCIALHPMGLQLAVGFKEKLKMYYLLEDEVRVAIDFQTKMCLAARYSNGGQYLAAANGNIIWIIDPYTFELKFQLMGHANSIRILQWNESDSMLMSVCNSGSAYGWQTNFEVYNRDNKNTKKKGASGGGTEEAGPHASKVELIFKNVKVHSVGYDIEFDLMFASTSDNKLHLFTTDNGKGGKNYLQVHTGADTELTSLLLAKTQSVLFAGTSKGSIRVYLWPMLKRKGQNVSLLQQSAMEFGASGRDQFQHSDSTYEYMEYHVHLGRVVSLSLSADKQSLVSASEDGTLYVLSIKEMCNGIDMNLNVSLLAASSSAQHQEILQKRKKAQNLNRCKVHLNMNQLSLVVRQAIEQKNSQIQELKYKVDNLKSFFQGELQNIADKKSQEINRINEKNAKELEEEKQRYKSLQEEHENERNYLLKTIENNLEAHKKELKEINDDYQLKLKNAYKQHDKLVEAYEESKTNYKQELEGILDKNKEALEQIEKEYRLKYEELQKNHIRLINDMKRDGEKFDIALEQCEQEYEKELLKRRDDFSGQMNKLSKNYDDLRTNHEKLAREKETTIKKLEDCEEIQFKLGQEQQQFQKKILDSNTRLVKMQEQLGEREEVIKTKEKSIKEMRNVNTHLENFRFVLDHKIRSLKDEKMPMEEQINNLEKHIKQMYQELLEECEKKKELMNKLKASEDKLGVLKKQLKLRQDEVVFTKRKLELLQYDLAGVIKNEALNDWPEKVSQVYEKHFEKKIGKQRQEHQSHIQDEEVMSADNKEEEVNVKDELIRQNNWMNNKLKSITDKNQKLEKEKKDLYLKIQKENTELIKECNMLRASNQKISKKVLVLEKKLKDISGISLSNANLVENQLEGFLKKAAPLSTKHRETPFMQMKKGPVGGTGNKRNQMLMDYYQQYAMGQTNTSNQFKGGAPDNSHLDGIIGEMQQNQNQIQMQNFEISQLQERVQQFLRQPSATEQTLPPIMGGGLMKSESQPVLGYESQQQISSGMSMTMRRDDSNFKSKQVGLSSTMSQASLVNAQQLQFSGKRKDSRSKQL